MMRGWLTNGLDHHETRVVIVKEETTKKSLPTEENEQSWRLEMFFNVKVACNYR